MLPVLSVLFVTSINDETLKCFPDHSWSSGRRLASHKHLAGSSSRRPSVASVPSSLQRPEVADTPILEHEKRPRKRDTRRVPKEETRGFETMETTGCYTGT